MRRKESLQREAIGLFWNSPCASVDESVGLALVEWLWLPFYKRLYYWAIDGPREPRSKGAK